MAAKRQGAFDGFTAEERAAMKEHGEELKKAARRGSVTAGDAEREVLEKIAGFAEPDRTMARRVHEIVMASAPALTPRLWYGMPAYSKDGKVLCHFQDSRKFKTRYATLGFSDKASLDDGTLWPVAYALTELTDATATRIAGLVRRAAASSAPDAAS